MHEYRCRSKEDGAKWHSVTAASAESAAVFFANGFCAAYDYPDKWCIEVDTSQSIVQFTFEYKMGAREYL